MTELLRGNGLPLGGYANRYPPEHRSILRLLRDQARALPDKVWTAFSERTLTFAQAHDEVWRAASAVERDLGRGAHVGLFLRNQAEYIPGLYGPMAADGVAVPLNAEARGPLLQYVIEKSDVRMIIARADLLEHLARLDGLGQVEQIVAVGTDPDPPARCGGVPVVRWDEWLAESSRLDDSVFPAFDRLCYLPFTSGTTGRQKGGMYSHHFLYLYSAMISDSLERGPDDVVSTPLPLYHVAGVHMITNSALQAGCTAHLKPRFSASRYWDEIAADGATYSLILGPMAAILLKTVPEAPPHRMTKVFCVPPPPGRREFEERYGVEMLWQGYGSTEVFPLPMPARMEPGVPEDTLGRPVAWMDFGVVDENDLMVGPGEVGEFVFRPRIPYATVSGYYGDPEATVHAFRNFAFHTGDHGYYDEDGRLHYRGRKQDRMRVKGENVSAAELEAIAAGHDAVLEAAAYGLPSEFGEEEIKLDVVLRAALSPADLREWLTDRLPTFAVPRWIEVVDDFPKTPTERIEKWKLKERPLDRAEVFDGGERRVRPRSSPPAAGTRSPEPRTSSTTAG